MAAALVAKGARAAGALDEAFDRRAAEPRSFVATAGEHEGRTWRTRGPRRSDRAGVLDVYDRESVRDTGCMSEQMTLRLDDRLAAGARAAASEAGASLSDWVRQAIRQQLALATARQARAEEDRRTPLYDDAQEDAILDARARESAAAFERDQ